MAIYTSDAFNRSDENPIADPWTEVNNGGTWPVLSSSQVTSNNGTWNAWCYNTSESWNANQISSIKLTSTPGSGNGGGPAVRCSGTTDSDVRGYSLYVTGTTSARVYAIYPPDESSDTLATITYPFASGDVLSIQIVGYVITVTCNGKVIWSGTDSNSRNASGSPGFVIDGTATMDDWWAGDPTTHDQALRFKVSLRTDGVG